MISFKTYLIESRSAPLYHATALFHVDKILDKGFSATTYQVLYKSKGQASWGRYGVSFARSIRSSDWYWVNENNGPFSDYAVFEVDQQKLASNYKIIPTDYFGTQLAVGNPESNFILQRKRRKESEEFVMVRGMGEGKYISPKYITAVHYFRKDGAKLKPVMVRYPNIKWIERS